MYYLITIALLFESLINPAISKKQRRNPITPHNVNPSQNIDGTWAIRNINSV